MKVEVICQECEEVDTHQIGEVVAAMRNGEPLLCPSCGTSTGFVEKTSYQHEDIVLLGLTALEQQVMRPETIEESDVIDIVGRELVLTID